LVDTLGLIWGLVVLPAAPTDWDGAVRVFERFGKALPRLAKVWPYFRRPRPDEPPPKFPVWPLWYAALAWLHVRQAGALLVVGLAAGAVLRAL